MQASTLPRSEMFEEEEEEEEPIGKGRAPAGHPSVAEFIAEHRDHSAAIYRHYDDLAARNILYLQSELAELRSLQIQYDQEDAEPGELDAKERCRDWSMFKRLAEEPDGFRQEQERMRLMLKIRATLNEYREAILQDSQMLSFRPPTRQAHEAFRWKFNMGSDNEKNSVLLGGNWGLYTDRHDLIALTKPAEEDRLTAALRNYLPFLFPGNIAREDGVNSCDENKIRRTVTAISVGLAFRLLYGAILTFYYVRSEKTVLGLAAVYTIAFALAVGLLTNAKRSEIIIAVAAYTAVIVLLISSPLGSLNSGSSLGNGTRCVCR